MAPRRGGAMCTFLHHHFPRFRSGKMGGSHSFPPAIDLAWFRGVGVCHDRVDLEGAIVGFGCVQVAHQGDTLVDREGREAFGAGVPRIVPGEQENHGCPAGFAWGTGHGHEAIGDGGGREHGLVSQRMGMSVRTPPSPPQFCLGLQFSGFAERHRWVVYGRQLRWLLGRVPHPIRM